ncbi:WSC domain-containing protein [Colletotrichum scovillei]|uniref:WSC domain-containing protein n=1 Tax=Colletotrichum scovillei TaxID=1209932 RepID=A0A9P7U7F0_9PEZI|nr:WSC domain-containing protein [Colletotrichum scovillei]KAG7064435.1 WSC domain-containing protein [Colletotrichum scovillei]
MRLPGPSMPSQRQSQTAAGIALVILALFTAFAVTQAVRPSQDESTLSQKDNIVQARQFLPWIIGGGQTTTIANPAQPAIATPLPAVAPPTPNNQQQQGPLGGVIPQVGHVIPSLLASLTSALAAVVTPVPSIINPGNVVPVVTNVVPAPVESILQPGGGPVIPTAIPNVEGSNGGLLPPIQSAVNSIVGAGGSAVPLPTGAGLPVPLPTQVVGGIPVSEVTAAIGNGASIITNIPEVLVSVVSSIVGHIPSAVNNLPSAIPVSDVVGATEVVPGLSSLVESVLQSASVIMPLPTTAPQLPEDLPTDGNLCTGVLYQSWIPTFIAVPCPGKSSSPATSAAPLSNAPASNSAVVPANPPVSSQVGLFTPAATPTAGPSQTPSTASSPAGGATAIPPASNPSTQGGAGGPGNNGRPQNTAPAGQPQSPVQSLNPVDPKPANPSTAATQAPNQGSGGAGGPSPAPAPAASPLTTLTVAAGSPVSSPNGVPANDGNGQNPSPTSQTGGSVFGVDEGQDPSSGNSIPPGTPVIPISDCPAVVQCPACPASPAKPPSGSYGSGTSGPANVPEPPATSPAPPPSNPNPPASPGQPPSPVSPAPNGNPPAGYGNSPANPANGNPDNRSGAPSGNGAPGNTGTSIPGPGSNAGAGSGNGFPDSSESQPAPEVTGWEYLGCFKDSAVRTLDGDPSIYFTGSMSNEKCIAHCGSMGFQLAGTEYGKECWCGTAFQLAVRIPEEQCNEVCDGKSNDICGGDWAVTVYSKTGRALSLPSDDDVANGAGGGNGNGNGNGNSGSGTGNNGGAGNPPSAPQNPAPGPPAGPPAAPPASPPQTPGQAQPPPPPAGNPQDSSTPPVSPNPAPQPQIDIASLIQSIINALPKSSPDGAYGSSLGARDSGASGSNGPALPVNSAVPDNNAGGSPMMGPGPINPMEGLSRYGDEKKVMPSRNMKRSSIIGRRAAARFDGIVCVGEDENDGDCLAKAEV